MHTRRQVFGKVWIHRTRFLSIALLMLRFSFPMIVLVLVACASQSAKVSTQSVVQDPIQSFKQEIERLQKKGPEVLFFRGISLMGDVYPSPGDRSMLDVDILVRERDLPRLTEALKGIGLTETEPGVFCKPGFTLDLHTSFTTFPAPSLNAPASPSLWRMSSEKVYPSNCMTYRSRSPAQHTSSSRRPSTSRVTPSVRTRDGRISCG